MTGHDRLEIVRECYGAFVSGDRSLVERHLAEDFTFSAPPDVGIDRATFFERCWPNSGTIEAFEYERLFEAGDEVFVTYESTRTDGRRFRNTEIFGFDGDRICRQEVYFGWDVEGSPRAAGAAESEAAGEAVPGPPFDPGAMSPAARGGHGRMSSVTCQISISLDGFAAGPDQSVADPLGKGGMRLHEWALGLESWRAQHGLPGGERNADADVVDEVVRGVGAYIMGRRMFGGGDGPWDETWRGWWGDEPPFHAPVFVLTHHPREPLPLQGGTTFFFVTEGIESALEQARAAAGGQDVAIAGGAGAVRQYLSAGLLDELYLHIVPVLLGAGDRLLEDVGDPTLEPVKVIASPAVTHVKYRVVR